MQIYVAYYINVITFVADTLYDVRNRGYEIATRARFSFIHDEDYEGRTSPEVVHVISRTSQTQKPTHTVDIDVTKYTTPKKQKQKRIIIRDNVSKGNCLFLVIMPPRLSILK